MREYEEQKILISKLNKNLKDIYNNYVNIFKKFNANHSNVFIEFIIKDSYYVNIIETICRVYINYAYEKVEEPYDIMSFNLFLIENGEYDTLTSIIYDRVGEYICQPKI